MSGMSFLASCILTAIAGLVIGFLAAWALDVVWKYVNELADAYIAGMQLYSVQEVWR